MVNPDPTEVMYSMVKREIQNGILSAFGLDVRTHPLGRIAWQAFESRYSQEARAYLEMMAGSPPASVDAGVAIAKEAVSERIDGFAEKMKRKLEQKESTPDDDAH